MAKTDRFELYDANMASDLNIAGISRSGSPGNYTYAVMINDGLSSNRPIAYVNWFNAARFANWMSNGQPTGPQSASTTENGTYDLSNASNGTRPLITPKTMHPHRYRVTTFMRPRAMRLQAMWLEAPPIR